MPKCEICYKEAELKECKIVDRLGTRYRNLCPECMAKLNSNKTPTPVEKTRSDDQSASEPIWKENTQTEKKPWVALYVCGILLLLVALVLYVISVSNEYGVANIQATTFSAAAFVSAIVSITGGTIIRAFKK